MDATVLLKDWSVTVIVVDSGLLTALGVGLLTDRIAPGGALVSWSVVLLAVSLFSVLWVLGALPRIAEQMASEEEPRESVYWHRNLLGVPICVFAFLGHFSLVAAVVLLGVFLMGVVR